MPRTEPRKAASQARSRETVDALLRATARILVRHGYEQTNTNKIAEAAGVSVGSLYQYFPNKEALVAAVVDRHQEEIRKLAYGAVAEVAGKPIEAAVRALVRVGVDAHRIDPQLHKVLAEEVPRVGRLQNVGAGIREGRALLSAYLSAHRNELSVAVAADLELATFVCVTTVEALTHAAVVDRASPMTEEEADRLVTHVTQLVVGYLCAQGHR
jgi:AcrR family transcriptional regulator